MMKKLMTALILITILTATVFAQWSDDPGVNTTVNGQTGEQTQPKVCALSDDGFYVGFYNHNSGNYDIYLQRYDAEGNALWAENGMAVSTQPALSWITDWSMMVDSNDNAIITFNDGRDGGDFDAFAYKISPSGEFLWGANGVQLSANDVGDMFPTVTELTDGSFIFAWNSENESGQSIAMQRLSSDGIAQWIAPYELPGIEGYTNEPGLMATSDGNFILTFADNTGSFPGITRKLYARKYTPSMETVWDNDAVISDAGGLAWHTHPVLIPDEDDGFIYTWHDDQNSTNASIARIQRIGSDGSVMFTDDGVNLSPLASELNYEPYPVYLPDSDEVMVFWGTTNTNQSSWGIRAQLVNSSGEIQWGTNGEVLVALNADYPRSFLDARRVNGDGVVTWLETQGAAGQVDYVKSIRLNAMHQQVWGNAVTVSNFSDDKMKKVSAVNSQGMILNAWVGGDNIYAQNVNPDGSLGTYVPPMPGLTITSPEDGSSFNLLPLEIGFDLENFEMNETSPAEGDGVIKIDLDGEFLVEFAGSSPFVVDELTEGEHTFIMTLIDGPSGNPLDPNVSDTLTVTFVPPTITITSPAEGAELTVLPVEISFELTNFTIDPETPANGDGVIQVIMDDSPLGQFAETSTISFETLENGEHTITLVLYDGIGGDPIDPEVSDSVTFTLTASSVDNNEGIFPSQFTLEGNYPNPFNARTSIKFGLPDNAEVAMSIFSITGQKVMEYNSNAMSAGWHTVTWDASTVSSGVYFVQLKSGSHILTHKMMLIK